MPLLSLRNALTKVIPNEELGPVCWLEPAPEPTRCQNSSASTTGTRRKPNLLDGPLGTRCEELEEFYSSQTSWNREHARVERRFSLSNMPLVEGRWRPCPSGNRIFYSHVHSESGPGLPGGFGMLEHPDSPRLVDAFLAENSSIHSPMSSLEALVGEVGQLLIKPKAEETLLRDRARRSAAEKERHAAQQLPGLTVQLARRQASLPHMPVALSALCDHRPLLTKVGSGAQIFRSNSTASSRAMAIKVLQEAAATNKIHGRHPAPRLFAQRLEGLKDMNRHFRDWCKDWIAECYHTACSELVLPKVEPHIIKYDGTSEFTGINIHTDHSFVSVMMGLNDQSDYEGGGTYFPHLDQVVHLDPGEVLVFQGRYGPYSALHRGNSIISGKRALYLAFFQLRGSGWENRR